MPHDYLHSYGIPMHNRESRVPTYLSNLPPLMQVEIQSNQLLAKTATNRMCLMTANPGMSIMSSSRVV